MKARWVALLVLVAAIVAIWFGAGGCSNGTVAYVNVRVDEMTPKDLDSVVTTGLKNDNEVMIVKRNPSDPKARSTDMMFLFTEYHYSGKMGYLRNPDVVVAVLNVNPDAKAITAKDRELLERLAKDRGLEIVPSFKLDAIFGPDGKTPKVMPLKASQGSLGHQGTLMSILAFPTQRAAEEAKEYIDSAYATEVRHEPKPPFKPAKPGDQPPAAAGKDWILTASLKADMSAANVEMDEFTRLAEKFGGVLLSTTAY